VIVERKLYYATIPQSLHIAFDDGERLELRNNLGNVMFIGTRRLYEQCIQRGWFREREAL
jgi:hypothetical protein